MHGIPSSAIDANTKGLSVVLDTRTPLLEAIPSPKRKRPGTVTPSSVINEEVSIPPV